MRKDYEDKLRAIQWITNNQKFNEKQHIELGNAICAFEDCIEENKKLLETLEFVVKESGTSTNYNLRARQTLSEIKKRKGEE